MPLKQVGVDNGQPASAQQTPNEFGGWYRETC
jgi:hypothetical protein